MAGVIDSIKEINTQEGHVRFCMEVTDRHSPAAVKLLDLGFNCIKYADEAAREGKNVIYFPQIGYPLAFASGAIPMFLMEMGRLATSAQIQAAEEQFQILPETCAMSKATLGTLYLHRNNGIKRFVSWGSRCEPLLQVAEMAKGFGYDVHIMDVGIRPGADDPAALENERRRYLREFLEVADWAGYGKPLDKNRLWEALALQNRIQKKMLHFLELRREHCTYCSSLTTSFLFGGNGFYYGKPREFEQILDALNAEMEALKPGEYNDARVRLMWAGPRGIDFGIYNAVDASGGSVVALQYSMNKFYDLDIDPLEAFLSYEYDGYKAGGGGIRKKIRGQEMIFRKSGAQGAIISAPLACTYITIEAEIKRKYFQEQKIPCLHLTTTYQTGEASGQTLTRIKAFVEMLM